MAATGTIPNTPEQLLAATERHIPKSPVFLLLQIALSVLADRCLLWLSMVGTMGLYGYAIYEPTVLREVIATSFALMTFVPQVVWGRKEK